MPKRWYPKIKMKPLGWYGRGASRNYLFGDCEHRPRKGALIRIDTNLKPDEHLETLVHECLHAFMPRASEAKVSRVGHRLASVLWKQGFRKLNKRQRRQLKKSS